MWKWRGGRGGGVEVEVEMEVEVWRSGLQEEVKVEVVPTSERIDHRKGCTRVDSTSENMVCFRHRTSRSAVLFAVRADTQ